jgi:predicted nucleic acid-binding protein
MSSKRKLLFDTHAFLAFFNKEEGSETIKNLMDEIENGKTEGFVAAITLTELAYIYMRKMNESSARLRVMQIQHSKIRVIPMDANIAVDAGIIKHQGISVADAIIAASARSVFAAVVTNDTHFTKMDVSVIRYP